MEIKPVLSITQAVPTLEGAGVRLHRAFGFYDTQKYDPFLLLDDFRGDDPLYYRMGFPMHPHRGIQTVTYMLEGWVDHKDSIGNKGTIGPGGVQWMTSGSGIIHEEMPRGDSKGRMYGFQLWVNLPSGIKMSPPEYQEFSEDEIPSVSDVDGSIIKIICGKYSGIPGPVHVSGVVPSYFDISIPPDVEKIFDVSFGHNAIIYIYNGTAKFSSRQSVKNRELVLFGDGDCLKIKSGKYGVNMLLISGAPLNEPVAWRGPIVMNTHEELNIAFSELESGTFLKY